MLNLNLQVARQKGATLMEVMVSLALSMLVVSSMVVLMGNSLGSASRIIQMTQLSDELRNTMSMMTRDLRRANYNANAHLCYANSDCGIDGAAAQVGEVIINANQDCMVFNLDRDQDGDGTENTDGAGGFRLRQSADNFGFVEMWVGGATPAGCATAHADWVPLTDPEFVDITALVFDDTPSIVFSVEEEGGGILNQRVREIWVTIEGELVLSKADDFQITRRLDDTIKVRNDFLWNP